MDNKMLARRLQQRRKSLGLTQEDLSKATDRLVSANTIARQERAEFKDINGQSLAALASALGTTMDFLVGRTNVVRTVDDLHGELAHVRQLLDESS